MGALQAVRGEAAVWVTQPGSSHRLQIRYFASPDSSRIDFRSPLSIQTGWVEQSPDSLRIHDTASGETVGMATADIPAGSVEGILGTSLFAIFSPPLAAHRIVERSGEDSGSDAVYFEDGTQIGLSPGPSFLMEIRHPGFAPSLDLIRLEGLMPSSGGQDEIRLARRVTLIRRQDSIRILLVHSAVEAVTATPTPTSPALR